MSPPVAANFGSKKRHDFIPLRTDISANLRFALSRFTPTFSTMTEVQQQMIDKAFELLSEHFDHVVIAVGTYDEDKQYMTTANYYGGVAPAIGLCKLYEKRWIKDHLWGSDDEME
jgi:hypothetical protein